MGSNVREEELVEVEKLKGEPYSFMTKNSHKALMDIGSTAFFLPVTTRTEVQYNRVMNIFSGTVPPQFAVISNGAVVLENGEPVKEWSAEIRRKCIDQKTVLETLLPLIERYFSEEWVLNIKQADDWFVYLIIDRARFPAEQLASFSRIFREMGWSISLQGRKLYFMPESITKARAMEYVKQRLQADYVVAAGDSLLDLDLLESADEGLLAAHGEAVQNDRALSSHIRVTKHTGIKAGEEILAHVANIAQHR
ncbi:hydroxymethylpyrimidine pyrophosphatase-like HAD family hydrolase [Planomicrobium soli]|uniref:Hydroxymethylpyrimidine pyrophosphatase-like HAD family hydrolase n=2 Tax=Planomicrobium soli TaxID=1176648 RepID=A0A2P8GK70_9BACL|nr:hydroxymethylpyrimidine pyrophosphatase-like HAD family hydrolase [Planomicrobium soli]